MIKLQDKYNRLLRFYRNDYFFLPETWELHSTIEQQCDTQDLELLQPLPPSGCLSSAPPPRKEGKIQTTQTEGERGLLDDSELLRQLSAQFAGIPLFEGLNQEGEAQPRQRHSLT